MHRRSKCEMRMQVMRLSVVILCLVVIAFLPACRKPEPIIEKPDGPSSVEDLDPIFRIKGYEDKINSEHGLSTNGLAVVTVVYALGSCYPATEFVDAMKRHFLDRGWICPKYDSIYNGKPELAVTTWRSTVYDGETRFMMQIDWVKDKEFVTVIGSCLAEAGHPGPVRFGIMRYHPEHAEDRLKEYEDLYGEPAVAPEETVQPRKEDPDASADQP